MRRRPAFRLVRQAGIALIEALLALAVMAFGMLAVVGLQATLRQNADLAKQRSEAVRIAQQEVERWRAYATLQAAAGTVSFGNLQDGALANVAGSNASYSIARSVDPDTATAPPYPPYKTFVVDVGWTDRNGVAQNVRLSTALAATPPQLAGTLSVPANGVPTRQPGGRNADIPVQAQPLGNGTSGFRPPQAVDGTLVWVFDNMTALITVCTTTAATTADLTLDNITGCTDGRSQLLSGFVRFATDTTQPAAADAVDPPSVSQPLQVQVLRSFPSTATVECFEYQQSLYVSYYCAVPIGTDPLLPPRWSGRSIVNLAANQTDVAAELDAAKFRVCRYTRLHGDPPVPSTINAEHPRDYANVDGPLANQNFLIIRAGNGTAAFTCPADDATTTDIDSTTWPHPST